MAGAKEINRPKSAWTQSVQFSHCWPCSSGNLNLNELKLTLTKDSVSFQVLRAHKATTQDSAIMECFRHHRNSWAMLGPMEM